MEISRPIEGAGAEVAHIGKSVVIRGELSGSEDLYLDGEVEGSIELREHHLTIGPHGRVRASVHARDVVVHGQLNGNVHGTERVELKKSAVLTGDVLTKRIVIEVPKAEPKRDTVQTVAASGAASAFTGSPSVAGPAQEALVEHKK